MANFRAKTTKREEVNTTYSLESVSCLQPKINNCSRKGYCVAGLTASSMIFWCFVSKLIPEANIFNYIIARIRPLKTTLKFAFVLCLISCRYAVPLLHFLLFLGDFL